MNTSQEPPCLLAIDDDHGVRSFLSAALGETYTVEQAIDGRSGIARAVEQVPDLILLDITMPGLSGYEVCRELRSNEATRTVPVIFLSAFSQLEDRLGAYDAGGDDFLAKPFDLMELADKVATNLRRAVERRQLVEEKQSAFAAAMAAMSATSEIGAVMGFLRQSFSCTTYAALADAIIETAATWDLSVAVQLRGNDGEVSRNRGGASPPLEAGVLATLADCGRIASLGRRLAVSFHHVTVMAVDMPIDDPERSGRLRDDLAWLVEAAEARIQALDNEQAIRSQQQMLHRLVSKTGAALTEIENCRQLQKATAVVFIQDMLEEMERSFLTLGLTDAQEAGLSESLRTGIDKVIDIFDQGLAIDNHQRIITAELAGAAEALPAEIFE